MKTILQTVIILGSVLYAVFGFVHLFWPKIFAWEEEYKSSKIAFSDTIKTVNFYMSIQIIVIGLAVTLSTLFFWKYKETIETLLLLICVLLILRLARAIILPIRIPIKNAHNYFILLFVFELLLFGFPLIVLLRSCV